MPKSRVCDCDYECECDLFSKQGALYTVLQTQTLLPPPPPPATIHIHTEKETRRHVDSRIRLEHADAQEVFSKQTKRKEKRKTKKQAQQQSNKDQRTTSRERQTNYQSRVRSTEIHHRHTWSSDHQMWLSPRRFAYRVQPIHCHTFTS